MYAVPLQGKQASLAISSPGEKQRIRGAAGTGKTTVLAQRAINCFTMSHEPVLILYFNVTLGSYLKSKIFQQNHTLFSPFFPNDSLNSCFHLFTYDSFLAQMAQRLKIRMTSMSKVIPQTAEDWQNRRNDFNRKIREVIALHRQDGTVENFQYKTILIDEFQDFAYDEKNDSASWIRLIQDCFLKEEGELVVFSDASQNVRGTPLDKTGSPYTPGFSGRWNTLATNFRFSTVTSMVTKAFQSAFMPANSQDVPSPSKKESPLGGFGFADPSLSNRKYNDREPLNK